MKKTIAILLVAIMAVGFVFADATLSGKFTSKLAYDIDENKLAFSEPDNALDVNFSLSSGSANEDDIYAVIKGELTLIYESDKAGGDLEGGNGIESFINSDDSKFEITEAAIYGQGWNLSILKADEMTKYAAGWETYNDGDDNVDLKAPVSFKDDYGVTFTLDNIFKAGFSVDADFDENEGKNILAWASTDDLNIAGIVANVSVGVTKDAASKFTYVGLGLEAGYENDSLGATVASDMSIGVPTEKNVDATFDVDVAANVNYADMVTVDAYYATDTILGWDMDDPAGSEPLDTYEEDRFFVVQPVSYDADSIENYLSAKIGFDMNAFDVPVKLTLAAMDIVNNPYFDLEAATSVAGFDITVFGGYQAVFSEDYYGSAKLEKKLTDNYFHIGGDVAYTIEPVGTISGGIAYAIRMPNKDVYGYDDAFNELNLNLKLKNTTLVSGATLEAGWESGNLIENKINGYKINDAEVGEIYVKATIEF